MFTWSIPACDSSAATSRAVVVRSVLAEFTDLLADEAETWRPGDGLDPGVRMEPIVDETQLRKVRAKIDEGNLGEDLAPLYLSAAVTRCRWR
jgi:acyl-CoA reductase-like NAD-dependent aldehyde dehydrogenase